MNQETARPVTGNFYRVLRANHAYRGANCIGDLRMLRDDRFRPQTSAGFRVVEMRRTTHRNHRNCGR